ncbi:hypothetical protein [Brevibacterium antiquum]|uniref:Uncharacterized protein n=1 Tax=Brevibacterium antiquum TaxID=234835 RepID=A0A2H1JTP0_9MICO|nr:hypothetical protein [Brevibacterium antiquum]SMX90895.1 hypothetical protein BANT10_02366 [Brevibacterium antiquum]
MAEEQFTSRRARREAERLAAEQAFEARETPEQPSEPSPSEPAELLNSSAAPAQAPESHTGVSEPEPSSDEPEPVGTTSHVDAEPPPPISHEHGASAADHGQESRPPGNAEERLDPQAAPLPHFSSRTARKNYLREHGLSLEGDVSTGALPVIAGPEETSPEESDEAIAGEYESLDTAGFGGSADEVAARDFESPVTPDSAPRPTALGDAPHDALSQPIEDLDAEVALTDSDSAVAESPMQDDVLSSAPQPSTAEPASPAQPRTEPTTPERPAVESAETDPSAVADDAGNDDPTDERGFASRSRRMPIVQPPSSSGVRVVTAASAKPPEVEGPETIGEAGIDEAATGPGGSALDLDSADTTDSAEGAGTSSDDAARALAANPETRPMEAVPEAWALPNSDYEDEETENPPGTRIRASEVTGHDGRILVGEEPSKVPYVVLGVAALFAVALIVIALVMLL